MIHIPSTKRFISIRFWEQPTSKLKIQTTKFMRFMKLWAVHRFSLYLFHKNNTKFSKLIFNDCLRKAEIYKFNFCSIYLYLFIHTSGICRSYQICWTFRFIRSVFFWWISCIAVSRRSWISLSKTKRWDHYSTYFTYSKILFNKNTLSHCMRFKGDYGVLQILSFYSTLDTRKIFGLLVVCTKSGYY